MPPKPRCNWATNSNGLKGQPDCQFQRQTRPTESFSVSVTAIPAIASAARVPIALATAALTGSQVPGQGPAPGS